MKKIETAENSINEALCSALERLDVEVGAIKRSARNSESFSTGRTVTDVASAAQKVAEELVRVLTDLHSNRKGPTLIGKGKFNSSFQSSMQTALSVLSQYCHTVVEETSIVTNQKHMYDKEYRRLHQSLESLQLKLLGNTGAENP